MVPSEDVAIPDPSADGGVSEISDLRRKKVDAKKKIKEVQKIGGFNSKIRESRDKTMYRDNWNYFVGDTDFKTDSLLRFQEKHMKYQYHKFLLASSAYSVRILLTLATVLNLYLTNTNGANMDIDGVKSYGLQIGLFGAAIFASTPKFSSTIN